MRTRRAVEERASALGARPETLEKVLILLEILARLEDHELTRGQWMLKGGTALNVFHLELPRLSVDIDLNFVGEMRAAELADRRRSFERGLRACCERSGCSVRRIAPSHAGGKVSLQFSSVFGSGQALEVDVNYVLRIPILGIDSRAPSAVLGADPRPLPLLRLHEIAAGKFCALLTRSEPRDFYDALQLLELEPGLPRHPDLRLAFVALAACQRPDFRRLEELPTPPGDDEVRRRLEPMLRRVPGGAHPDALASMREGEPRLRAAAAELLDWTPDERRFLDDIHDRGELTPESLTDDRERRERIRGLPMLHWKLRHVREHLGLDVGTGEEEL